MPVPLSRPDTRDRLPVARWGVHGLWGL